MLTESFELPTAASRCRLHQRVHSLPVHLDEQQRLVLTVGPAVGAIVMPDTLGAAVFRELAAREKLGPVISRVRSATWVFITQPAPPGGHPELFRHRVTVVSEGTGIVLPGPADFGTRAWAAKPRGAFRPVSADVVALARGVVKRPGRGL